MEEVDSVGDEWVVNVTLARREITLRGSLVDFPSERLITQLMLVT